MIILVAVFGIIAGCGCAGNDSMRPISPADINRFGTFRFFGSRDAVYKATIMALETVGFRVTLKNPSRGILLTNRIGVRRDVDVQVRTLPIVGTEATVTVTQRQLRLRVWLRQVAKGRISVKIVPTAFQNGQHMGYWPWGRAAMRRLWSSLYRKIRLGMPGRPAVGGPGTSRPEAPRRAREAPRPRWEQPPQ